MTVHLAEFSDITCPMPDCAEPLYLTWTHHRPLFGGDLAAPAPIDPDGAYTGSWEVECVRGHVVLLPANVEACECAEEFPADHDHDDEKRTFRASDLVRLDKQIRTITGGAS